MTPDEYATKIYELVAARGMLTDYNDGSVQKNGPSDREDREWFADNPDRTHRVRPLCADEDGQPGAHKLIRVVRGMAPLTGDEPRMGFLRIGIARSFGDLDGSDSFLGYIWDEKVSVALGVDKKDVAMPRKFESPFVAQAANHAVKCSDQSGGDWTLI